MSMGRVQGLTVFLGLLLVVGMVALHPGSGLNTAAVLFTALAAWWGIALGVLSDVVTLGPHEEQAHLDRRVGPRV